MAKKEKLLVENDYTPVTYDPQYILMVNHLKKYFPIKGGLMSQTVGHVKAVDGVTFNLKRGHTMGLVGESGCGKSTTLRMIAGLEHPDSGEIRIDGKVVNDIPASKRGIGFVFQNYALFRYMTVYDNIAFGLKIQKVDRKTIASRVMELVDLIGLRGLERRYPSQLSGGQRQRVAIGRAIVREPKVLLMDEPLSNLDAALRVRMRGELKRLQRELGITMVFVTHDQEEALILADSIAVMSEGELLQLGSAEEVFRRPANNYIASFLGLNDIVWKDDGSVLKVIRHGEKG